MSKNLPLRPGVNKVHFFLGTVSARQENKGVLRKNSVLDGGKENVLFVSRNQNSF